ncbi:MAG: thiazole synthase [Pseudobacteriovorax sp.]|nr:thiazole synthase [Pseudobacteriovorax sp.]
MTWNIGGKSVQSRLLLGTARYPSPQIMRQSIASSGSEIITVSLRRESVGQHNGNRFWDYIKASNAHILPNTAGCHSVKEVITTAHMARDLFDTNWIKVEVIGHDDTLQPDVFGLVEATKILIEDGFEVFPYTTEDLVVAQRLVDLGCRIIMPWGSPIGTGKGLRYIESLKSMRHRLPDVNLIVDAGIGKPSHACQAMELGFDGVLLNTAVATAVDPETMATAFGKAVEAGRQAYQAGLMQSSDRAIPSTPLVGKPFWHENPL